MPAVFRRFRVLRRSLSLSAVALAFLGIAAPAPVRANLVIIPTFDSSITSDPNAAVIMGTINTAIQQYENTFSDPITVRITFQEGGGLGMSSTPILQYSYSTYLAALTADAKTADDATALASLPVQATSPVDGNTNMWITTANARAVGLAGAASSDGTITLNTSIMNLSRNTIDPTKYDLQSVAEHEIDEVLGMGSGLNLPTNFPRLSRPQDLFRYSAPGVRSYTTSSSATSYFSIDGGVTNLAGFNQTGGGSDYGDWNSSGVPRVQDAFGTPGATPDLSVELVNLDVIGYDRIVGATVPEPSTVILLGAGALVCLATRIYRRKATA